MIKNIELASDVEVRYIEDEIEIKGIIPINDFSEILFSKEKNIFFRERILFGAFNGILKKGNLPKLILNHDYSLELKGRFEKIKETCRGLEFIAVVKDEFNLRKKVKFIKGLSFGFVVGIDRFHKVNSLNIRDIYSFKELKEISILIDKEPCYSSTKVSIEPLEKSINSISKFEEYRAWIRDKKEKTYI
ncbi:HK97 family phage prohead protease [Clostridium perfringens]|nr:HK97 family phage prohead protease [Clostridium perfringens]MDM0964125.1 HK97 family phage prohead protease [Clostridium perfringens]